MPLCHHPRCRAPIIMAETENGKPLALDRDPTSDGTYGLVPVVYGPPLARHVGKPADGGTAYRVHVASCRARAASVAPVRGWRKRRADSGD